MLGVFAAAMLATVEAVPPAPALPAYWSVGAFRWQH